MKRITGMRMSSVCLAGTLVFGAVACDDDIDDDQLEEELEEDISEDILD